MSVPHILFILTNAATIGPNARKTGYFFAEVAHPFAVFDQAGVAVEFASPRGGASPHDGYDDADPAQRAFMASSAIRRLGRSRKLSEVDVLDYDAIFIPGGLGPMVDITGDPEVQRAVLRAYDGGRLVGAVCHGPSALLGVTREDGAPLLQGRKVTAFSNAEEDGYARADVPFMLEEALRAAGADYSAAPPWQPHVVLDGRIMTGQNPASAGPLAEAMVAALRQAAR